MQINNQEIELSNEEKVLFPIAEITKGDLIQYYKKIGERFIPHTSKRPMALQRFPDGIKGEGFYQKQIPDYFPQWIDTYAVEKKEGGTTDYVLGNNLETMVYLANQAMITPHGWLSTTENIHHPDRMIFDLDPSTEKDFNKVQEGALFIKGLLDDLDLKSFPMTTGSQGIHIVLPLVQNLDFDQVREIAKRIGKKAVDKKPNLFTMEMRKDKREGKVFIDIMRNAYGQIAVVPYGVRAILGAPIATPLNWEEVKRKDLKAKSYTIKSIFRRLGHMEDPWKEFYNSSNDLEKIKEV